MDRQMTTLDKTIAWLKARALTPGFLLGWNLGFLAAAALFTLIQMWVGDDMNTRAINNAQLSVAAAITEANRFRASLVCKGIPINGVCPVWEPRP